MTGHAVHRHWARIWEEHLDVQYDPMLETLRIVAAHLKEDAARKGCDPVGQLMVGLTQMLDRDNMFFAPGHPGRSFDESWLLALRTALHLADADSYKFLLLSRLSPSDASELHFLLRQAITFLDHMG